MKIINGLPNGVKQQNNIKNIKNKTMSVVVVGDKDYDSAGNHLVVGQLLNGFSVIPSRSKYIPVWKTNGKYSKDMKLGYNIYS